MGPISSQMVPRTSAQVRTTDGLTTPTVTRSVELLSLRVTGPRAALLAAYHEKLMFWIVPVGDYPHVVADNCCMPQPSRLPVLREAEEPIYNACVSHPELDWADYGCS